MPVGSRPFRAVIVIAMAISSTRVATVTGGVLRSSMRPTHGTLSSTTVASACTGASPISFVAFLFGFCGIIDYYPTRLFHFPATYAEWCRSKRYRFFWKNGTMAQYSELPVYKPTCILNPVTHWHI
jgi:hypothetical protein